MHLFLLATLIAASGTEQNWPEYRGPHGDGHSDTTGLPIHWSETENVRWKTPIHDKGWSSPVVWGDQVWLTTAREDGKQMFALCIDRRTGKVLHDLKIFEIEKPAFCHPVNSYASCTPAIEAGRIYLHFGAYGTVCLDTATAKTLWSRRDFPCDHWRGPASSPVLFDDLLFLQFDGVDRQYVVALDKKTGQTVWKKDRSTDYKTTNGDLKKAYGTPSILTIGDKPQLVSPAAMATVAYDPMTGEERWKAYHGGMNAAARPLLYKGLVFLCSGDGGEGLVAVRPDASGDLGPKQFAWERKKGVPNRASLLLVGDRLYMITENGVLSCVEAETGRDVGQGRLQGPFIASPVYADGHLYFFNREGKGYVVDPGPDLRVLATNQLPDGCMASPAVAGKALFVRTLTHLYCLERKD